MNDLSLAVLTVLFCGCFSSSSPTRTFVLSKVVLAKSEEPVQIRMGRIVLPDYLKRWEMVTLVKSGKCASMILHSGANSSKMASEEP